MVKHIRRFIVSTIFIVTFVCAQAGVYDVHIADQKNKTNIIIAVIIGVTIGGSIIFASYNKRK